MTRMLVAFVLTSLLLIGPPLFAQEKAQTTLKIVDAKLGTAVENRQIVGEGENFAVGQKVYLWLELKGGPAEDITVTWKHGDKTYQTTLKVGGPTYHTWAYKTAAMAGDWTVSVTDAAGQELKQLTFTVGTPGGK